MENAMPSPTDVPLNTLADDRFLTRRRKTTYRLTLSWLSSDLPRGYSYIDNNDDNLSCSQMSDIYRWLLSDSDWTVSAASQQAYDIRELSGYASFRRF